MINCDNPVISLVKILQEIIVSIAKKIVIYLPITRWILYQPNLIELVYVYILTNVIC